MIELTFKADSTEKLLTDMRGVIEALEGKPTTKQEPSSAPEEPAKPKTAPKPKEVKEQPSLTLEQVRSKIAEQSKAGKREDIKALLNEFGVARATELTEEQYPAFIEKLSAL